MAVRLTRRDLMARAKALALATPFLSLAACDGRDGARPSLLSGRTMGTSYGVRITDLPAGVDLGALGSELEQILETVNRQMSTYRPDSELSRLNAGASTAPVAVSADTADVLAEALRIAALSDGAFDPTVGPLVDLWGFGPGGGQPRVPSAERIEQTRRRTGFRKLRATTAPPAVARGGGDLHIDLCGIAKGFGVDRLAGHLEARGVGHYLVEIGGELRGRGWTPRGGTWRVGIERPGGMPGAVQRVVRLDGRALATSGDYRIFFESEGSRYSHIISPLTGRPVDHGLASVTVLAATAMRADALSTALMVMGPEKSLELAEREDIAAFFIVKRGDGFAEIASPAFARHLIA